MNTSFFFYMERKFVRRYREGGKRIVIKIYRL